MKRALAAFAILILAVSGCSEKSGAHDAAAADVTDTAEDSSDELASDAGPDRPDFSDDSSQPYDDLIPDDSRDLPEDVADDLREDAADDSTVQADDSTVFDAGPCPACPRGICDPETLQCVECTKDAHCGIDSFCDSGICRKNLCSPDAYFCVETTRYKCSANGGGFTVVEDCNDNDPCTTGDRCETGRCIQGTATDCSDGNDCTIDYCNVSGQCEHYAAEAVVCDDGNPCSISDMCSGGKCVPGGSKDCSDKNPCTFDYCISASGCIHEPQSGYCSDSSGCTENDRCIEGRCSGDEPDCDDRNPCTTDFCYSGLCRHEGIAGCSRCVADTDCDDSESCTIDTCDRDSGTCRNTASRTDGCCLEMTDCPETPQCTMPVCDSSSGRCILAALPRPDCCLPDVLNDSFDSGIPAGYLVDDAVESVGWRIGGAAAMPPQGISGGSMYFGNPEETDYDAGRGVRGSFISAPVILPADAAISLTFNTWQDVDSLGGFDTFDVSAIVETGRGPISIDLWTRPSSFPMRRTTAVEADLSALAGHTARLVFTFDSIDGISNAGRGIYVDDISVQADCSGLRCNSDLQCYSAGFAGRCSLSKCSFNPAWMEVFSFGGPGSGQGLFTSGTDLEQMPGPEGIGTQLAVSDGRTHYIQIFDENGTFRRMFGGYGTIPGRFLTPRGMAASENRLYIADSNNGRIQAITAAGVFLYSFGTAGIDPGQLDTPRGVAVSADGNTVFVADTGNHRISVFTRLGVYRYSFGGYGTGTGRFRTPVSVAVGKDGNIRVCDSQNSRIQILSSNGTFISEIRPSGDQAFKNPSAVAETSTGEWVVADTGNHRLVVLDADGKVRTILGGLGSGTGKFSFPSDVKVMQVGAEERLVVADSGNFRVSVWARRAW